MPRKKFLQIHVIVKLHGKHVYTHILGVRSNCRIRFEPLIVLSHSWVYVLNCPEYQAYLKQNHLRLAKPACHSNARKYVCWHLLFVLSHCECLFLEQRKKGVPQNKPSNRIMVKSLYLKDSRADSMRINRQTANFQWLDNSRDMKS